MVDVIRDAVRKPDVVDVPSKFHTPGDFIPIPEVDALTLVHAIEDGLPVAALDRFQERSGLSMQRVTKLVHIPARTLARRREEGTLTTEESDRLLSVARLAAAATNLFAGDVAAAMHWLSRPLRALGGTIPLDLAETEAGSQEVHRVILQLEHGVFP